MTKMLEFLRKQPRWRWIVIIGVVVLLGFWMFGGKEQSLNEITFTVKRGPMQISVLEGGSIEAQQSQEVRSEVKGSTKILKIVEEGYLVTEEDVRNGKVLVELDSSDIQAKLTQQEIQYQSAIASLTEARQSYEIQRNQNTSNIKAAEQKAQFARMDLQKFMGDMAYKDIVTRLKLDKLEAAASQLASGEDIEQVMLAAMSSTGRREGGSSEGEETNGNDEAPLQLAFIESKPEPMPRIDSIDFSQYADPKLLGDGSAMQQLRKLDDDLYTARQQQSLSQTKLEGTRRLFEKGFVTRTELDSDEISAKNQELKVQTAETALNLFIKYEFPKQAQELVSKYEEALRGLEREKKEAISKLAQSHARMKGAESRYNIESSQRRELLSQLEKCIIRAQKPGLVVYGGGSSDGYYSNNEQVREGATVRERQPLITIPDMAQMAVRVKVHESYIQKVRRGLKARIQVDAFPDRLLTGEVTKVALLPDSQNRWTNPDMKVYQTIVSIDGSHDWIKPGMSAKVEILVKHLDDVVYVPIQAVTELNGKQVCYVARATRPEIREVEVGDFNDEFIEIKRGLEEGEKVLLRVPANTSTSDKEKGKKKDSDKSPSESESTESTKAPSDTAKPAA